jgi:SAM-dependent methyltransferase
MREDSMDLHGIVTRFNRASHRLNLPLQIPVSGIIRTGNSSLRADLNEWQSAFCVWMGERLGNGEAAMRQRLLKSINAIRDGHGGGDFRRFRMLSYDLYLPFAADTREEVVDAYHFHSHMHFLRFMSYPLPLWSADHPVVAGLAGRGDISIVDFGCGLAQNSISLARALKRQGKSVRLHLADVSRLQLEFLQWFCAREGLAAETFHCSTRTPFPPFTGVDVVFAEEVLEHVHDPVAYVEALERMTAPDGFFLADVNQHEDEFMHVSPDLNPAREKLLSLGYEEIAACRIFRKSAAARQDGRQARLEPALPA